jgi:Zn-dependent peptidase ImmA (M78 family)
MPDAEARWHSDSRVIAMRESVFTGMQNQVPRARMTVAHELSHYLHRHEGALNRSVEKTGIEKAVPIIRFQEREATRTGPILLAPEHLVPEGADVATIVKMFGLSNEAAAYRKEEIDGIRRRRRGELRPLPQSIVDYLKEAKRRGHDVRTPLDD